MADDATPKPTDDLQFDTAEPVSTDSTEVSSTNSCAICSQTIGDAYFSVGGQAVCPACCDKLKAPVLGTRWSRLFKASLLGLGAGLIGAIIWFAIRRVTHYEIGLVAILVGLMVGKAVRVGSGNQGGRGYQILAVVLTYCCIAANYMPDIFESLLQMSREEAVEKENPVNDTKLTRTDSESDSKEEANTAAATHSPAEAETEPMGVLGMIGAMAILLGLVFVFSLTTPFLAGFENLIGLLIIGFALWEAWKLNARQELIINGPYQMRPRPAES